MNVIDIQPNWTTFGNLESKIYHTALTNNGLSAKNQFLAKISSKTFLKASELQD